MTLLTPLRSWSRQSKQVIPTEKSGHGAIMSQQPPQTVPDKLILLIKSAYWVALLIIAAMAMASYMLLQQMMAAQQHDEALLVTRSARRKRCRSASSSWPTPPVRAARSKQPALVASLQAGDGEFESELRSAAQTDRRRPAVAGTPRSEFDRERAVRQAVPPRLFLDRACRQWLALHLRVRNRARRPVGKGYLAGNERAQLDETVANATLVGLHRTRPAHQRLRRRAARKDAQRPPHAVLSRPSPSSCWWRCSSSGRCRTSSCAARTSWSTRATPWPSSPSMTG